MRPAPLDRTLWEGLGAPIHFGQDQTALYLSRAAAGFRLPAANPAARDHALAVLAPHMSIAPWGWEGRTRHALRALLLDRQSSMQEVARHLRIHPRSLRRALEREGTRFDVIKDEVRYTFARELLTLGSLSLGELAMTLDFASPSAFIRAFRRWSGTAPSAWRDIRGPVSASVVK
jgi:AraC-like DNA-binding protein